MPKKGRAATARKDRPSDRTATARAGGRADGAMARSPRSRQRQIGDMIRIAITIEAFAAIARTLPLGSVGYEVEAIERQRYIWLDRAVVDPLGAMRGPGESYSDVILRIAAGEKRA